MLLITEVARSHLTAATHHLQANIDNTLDDLDVMLEKTILPRPAELGQFVNVYIFHTVFPWLLFLKYDSHLDQVLIQT